MKISLLDVIRNRFLEAIRSVNPPGKWKILVVDEHAQRLLSAVLKTNDILEENVSYIEAINTRRTPQLGTEAMYLLMPTSANADRIIQDFSGGRQQYAAAHVFFLDGMEETIFEKISRSPAEPFLRQLVELYLNLNALERRAFTLETPEMFFAAYSPPRDPRGLDTRIKQLEDMLRFASKMLLNVCVSLNENPLIRYYVAPNHGPLGPLASPASATTMAATSSHLPPPESGLRWARAAAQRAAENAQAFSTQIAATGTLGGGQYSASGSASQGDGVAKKLAVLLQKELDDYRKNNPDFPKTEAGPTRQRGTMIITDRTVDVVAPLLHEFTYQAMANDVLRIDNGKTYKYKFNTAHGEFEYKTSSLSDYDDVWTGVRHHHMREAIDKLMGDFNQFLHEHAGFKSNEAAASLNDMKDMLASLPQYQDMREKFSLHLTMAQECMDAFEHRKLSASANVEQCCATAQTPSGKYPKSIVEEMVLLLDEKSVSSRDKVRLIALYIMFRDGVPDEDQRRLFQHARLSLAEQDAVRGLNRLGVRINRAPGDKDTKKLKFKTPSSTDEEYELSRYKPMLEHVLNEHASGKLDPLLFPFIRDAPTAFASSLTAAGSNTSLASGSGMSLRAGRTFGSSARTESSSTTASLRSGAGPPTPSTAPSSLRSAKPNWHRAPRSGGAASPFDNGPASGGRGAGAAGAGPPGSGRRGGRGGDDLDDDKNRQRIIVFVVGGLTYSEMRTAYQSSAKLGKEVYVGSSHILTPERFIDDLKTLEIEGVGSAPYPNGMPTVAAKDYQAAYDKRYFVPDAPAPAPPPPSSSKSSSNNNSLRPPGYANGGGGGGAGPIQHSSSSHSSFGRSPSPAPSTGSGQPEKAKKKKGLLHW